MNIYARQGDIVIDRLKKPTTETLEPKRDLVLAGGSSGHPHTLVGACLAKIEERRTLVRVAEPTRIEHAGQHKTVDLPAGDYEIRRKREEGERQVED
jgi:hypothetical protein